MRNSSYSLALFFSNSPPSPLDTLLGEHFMLGCHVLPPGSSTVEGNTIHMAANLYRARVHDEYDHIGNYYGRDGDDREAAGDRRRVAALDRH